MKQYNHNFYSFIFIDSNIKISNIDSTFNRQNLSSGRLITQQQQQQPRLSLSKWLCTTPTTTNRLVKNFHQLILIESVWQITYDVVVH